MTGCDHTEYTVYGHIDLMPQAIEFLAGVLLTQEFSPSDLEREKLILEREILEGAPEDTHPRSSQWRLFWEELLGGPNANLSRKSRIKRLKKTRPEAVKEFIASQYCTDRAALGVVAPGGAQQTLESIRAKLDQKGRENRGSTRRTANGNPPTLRTCIDNWENTWVSLFAVIPDTSQATRLSARLLAENLGNGPHSLLFDWFRTRHSVAYWATASSYSWLSKTVVQAFLSVPIRKLSWTLDHLERIVEEACDYGMTRAAFESLKLNFMRRYETQVDHAPGVASAYAYDALRTEPIEPNLIQNQIDALRSLTVNDFNQHAKSILHPQNRRLFVGGKVGLFRRRNLRRRVKRWE